MPVSVKNIVSNERGAALVVVSALLALAGVLMVLGLKMFHTEEAVDRREASKRQLEYITDQLASYVHRNRQLPCPARPNGAPGTVAFGREDRAGGGNCNIITGIVPVRALNLEDGLAYDAWGRLITYAVSPVFADAQNPAADTEIFYICRKRDDWMDLNQVSPKPPPASQQAATMANASKARFCCPGVTRYAPATDLEVRDETGAQIDLRPDQAGIPAAGSPQRTAVLDAFGNTIPPGATSNPDMVTNPVNAAMVNARNVVGFAVVMVSHGSNGLGAFDGSSVNARIPGAAGNELENGDIDRVFVDRPQSVVPGNNYFDDIVVWRDQFGLYNELNNASCSRPWR